MLLTVGPVLTVYLLVDTASVLCTITNSVLKLNTVTVFASVAVKVSIITSPGPVNVVVRSTELVLVVMEVVVRVVQSSWMSMHWVRDVRVATEADCAAAARGVAWEMVVVGAANDLQMRWVMFSGISPAVSACHGAR